MTSPTLPVSSLINVVVNLSPQAAQTQALNNMLILGSSDVIDLTERYRVYDDIDSVAADFGTNLPEYFGALLWFEQVPQPSQLLIGRWAKTATKGVLKGATLPKASQLISFWNAITTGEFAVTVDGGGPQTMGPVSFAGALNLPGVAAIITGALSGVTFTWNANFQRFEAESVTTGPSSSVSFLTTGGGGTDISSMLGMAVSDSGAYTTVGFAAETALSAVAFFELNYGQTFYGLSLLDGDDADQLSIGPFIDAAGSKHVFGVTTQEAGVLVPSFTTDLASELKALGLLRTFVQYSSSNPYAVISALARILTTNFGGNNTVITLMYKQEPGIVPENLNQTQQGSIQAKGCNVFAAFDNGTAILLTGITSNGTFLDIVTFTDWLAVTIQTACFNLFYLSPTKVPQTDAGMHQGTNVIEGVCQQGVVNGGLAPGIWDQPGFGTLGQGDFLPKGFYVFAPLVASQSIADRSARRSVNYQVAAKLAGAVQTMQIAINVDR